MNEKDMSCIGSTDDGTPCTARVRWYRSTQFAGDHPFCDAHARQEKDFGVLDETGGQYFWYWRDGITQMWLAISKDTQPWPSSAAFFALLATKVPQSVINHHTRAPNVPTEATIVEGDDSARSHLRDTDTTWLAKLVRRGPGDVIFELHVNSQQRAQVPFDNLVKAATRIDPDHAAGSERQIRELREQLAKERAKTYELQALNTALEERVARLEVAQQAFSEAAKS